ncbi:unnamed protein product [Nezara viridula]|uniref:Neuropeptide n=1 Tax=Nezara viridula TaxID=85310 RepID=A0A9P0HVC8_NEZVI|nr:unnamed protein product [Nezara viridula]
MYNSVSSLCLVLCVFVLSRTSLPLPIAELEIPDQSNDVSKINAPGSALEENDNDPPVYIMVPVVGDRSRRGADDRKVVNLDNVSYEVPTFIKFNESAKGDIEVSLIPNPDSNLPQAVPQNPNANGNGYGNNGAPNNNYCPPLNNNNNKSQPMQPVCLTLNIDNIFPPGKKISVTNSSEIKGTGAVLRIKFSDAKFDDCKSTDLLGAGLDQALRQRLDSQKKRKFNEDEEDEDSATTQVIDQKTLQELIFKILTSNKIPNSTAPTEEVVFLDKYTTEPSLSFLINPSVLQQISGKKTTVGTKRMTTLKSQSFNSPDFDSLLKTVEHITSTMPKEKLLSLLSSLINKAALNKEMSTNQ